MASGERAASRGVVTSLPHSDTARLLLGDGIEGHGCPPMSPMASGLVNMELNCGDGSLGTFLGCKADWP